MQTHEVETEAVDVIFLRPVLDRVDHVLSVHSLVGSGLVAAAGAVGIGAARHSVVILRRCLFKRRSEVEGVVVNNVHYNGDASVVERLNHLLELGDSNVAVEGIRGI